MRPLSLHCPQQLVPRQEITIAGPGPYLHGQMHFKHWKNCECCPVLLLVVRGKDVYSVMMHKLEWSEIVQGNGTLMKTCKYRGTLRGCRQLGPWEGLEPCCLARLHCPSGGAPPVSPTSGRSPPPPPARCASPKLTQAELQFKQSYSSEVTG